MRGKILMVTLWITSMFVFAACQDDDNNDDKPYSPVNSVTEAFQAKYPNAADVTWEKKGEYEKAEFTNAGLECDAWFDQSGQWMLTETDMSFAILPVVVKNGFSESMYGSWKVEDTKKIEQLNMPVVYRLEIESGNNEMVIYLNEEGELVKEANDDASSLPSAISSFIMQQYPKGVTVSVDYWQDGNTEVDILDASQVKMVLFDRNNNWSKTFWTVLKADVPQVVLDVLDGEAYNSFTIGSIEFIEYASGSDVYHFVLKKENTLDTFVEIDPQGNIVLD